MLPDDISHATYNISYDNKKATYECDEGYKTNSSLTERSAMCNSTDPNIEPWRRSFVTFTCAPGMFFKVRIYLEVKVAQLERCQA